MKKRNKRKTHRAQEAQAGAALLCREACGSDAAAEQTLGELMDSTLKTRDLRWKTERNGA